MARFDETFWTSLGSLVPGEFVSTWIRHLHMSRRIPLATAVLVLIALLLRCTVSLNSYSGEATPPLFGDFEAQRHWMELTLHLPTDQWYKQSPDNDLQYWGLDYPPLTAYFSYVFGAIAHAINPEWVALHTSHGFESKGLKMYMRATVIACDLAVFFPAAFYFASVFYRRYRWQGMITAAFFLLLQPPLVLIDHGHFQYNCVMLGLSLLAVALIVDNHRLMASFFFCCSLCFKQMSLYYAPAFFFFLLGDLLKLSPLWKARFVELFQIGSFVILGLVVNLWPFLSADGLLSVLVRIFPVGRGLYEDKVANIWCALSLFIKFKSIFDQGTLVQLSTISTLAAFAPSAIDLLMHPTKRRFVYALFNISLGFFLCSFMVHEKSILLVTMPATMLVLEHSVVASWFIGIANFSMFPLLKKDGLVIPYVASMLYWTVLSAGVSDKYGRVSRRMKGIMRLSYACMVLIHLLDAFVPVPARYPDLFTMLNVLLSTSMFVVTFFYFNIRQFQLPHVEEIFLQGQADKVPLTELTPEDVDTKLPGSPMQRPTLS